MSDFWAMSDVDKTLLVLKILLVAFAWAEIMIAAIVVMVFCLLLGQDYLEKREERRKEKPYSPQDDPQVAAFQLKQTRRRIRNEQDEFFDIVQELQDGLR